jgi:hypothetical protein
VGEVEGDAGCQAVDHVDEDDLVKEVGVTEPKRRDLADVPGSDNDDA